MSKIHVGVLRGGPSCEYELSLKTGGSILKNLSEEKYLSQDIVISRDGIWHKNGMAISPHKAIFHVDAIFNALHGEYGEDGKVQHILEMQGIPFTGSGSFSSAVSMNKNLSKSLLKKEGIKIPAYKFVRATDDIGKEDLISLFKSFPLPFIVKPAFKGSSLGLSLVSDFVSFLPALKEALSHSDSLIIEEYVKGVKATVGIIEGFRDQELYALPPIEIIGEEAIVPGSFPHEVKEKLENLARSVHKVLGLRHYSSIDFIVNPKRGIFVMNGRTLPPLSEESFISKALHSVGSSLSHFIDHSLELAMNRDR